MNTPTKTFLALLLAGAATAVSHADPVVFDQPATVGQYNTWESYADPVNNGGQTYESFSVSDLVGVTAVTWRGDYVDTFNPAANPAAPNTYAFQISFWSDKAGQPDVELSKQSIALADITSTSLGTIGLGLGQGNYQVPFFSYRAVLTSPFTVFQGQKYWISIRSISASTQPTWSWYSGSGGDGTTVQDFDNSRFTRDLDRSLTLEGNPDAVSGFVPGLNAAVTNKVAHISDGTPAVVSLTLTQVPVRKIVVPYTLTGDAVNGQDYVRLKGKVKFKPGQTTATVVVTPQGDLGGAAKKKVKITFLAGSTYGIPGVTGKLPIAVKIVNP